MKRLIEAPDHIDGPAIPIYFNFMQSWDQEEIKALAHAIWVQQGCPEGRAREHWQEAEQLFREKWLADKHDVEHQVRDLRAKSAGAL